MRMPFGKKWVCIDTCLVQEIAELWHLGIPTIESCCGHNKQSGYIAVSEEKHEQMIWLGYERDPLAQVGRLGFFMPKSKDGCGCPMSDKIKDLEIEIEELTETNECLWEDFNQAKGDKKERG